MALHCMLLCFLLLENSFIISFGGLFYVLHVKTELRWLRKMNLLELHPFSAVFTLIV